MTSLQSIEGRRAVRYLAGGVKYDVPWSRVRDHMACGPLYECVMGDREAEEYLLRRDTPGTREILEILSLPQREFDPALLVRCQQVDLDYLGYKIKSLFPSQHAQVLDMFKYLQRLSEIEEMPRTVVNVSTMGSGKTYVTCALAALLSMELFVICPNMQSMRKWERVAGLQGARLAGITTYHKLRASSRKKEFTSEWIESKGRCSKAFSRLAAGGRLMFAVDEFHAIKNKSSLQTSLVKVLLREVRRPSRDGARNVTVLISSTPIDKISMFENLFSLMGLETRNGIVKYCQTCAEAGLVEKGPSLSLDRLSLDGETVLSLQLLQRGETHGDLSRLDLLQKVIQECYGRELSMDEFSRLTRGEVLLDVYSERFSEHLGEVMGDLALQFGGGYLVRIEDGVMQYEHSNNKDVCHAYNFLRNVKPHCFFEMGMKEDIDIKNWKILMEKEDMNKLMQSVKELERYQRSLDRVRNAREARQAGAGAPRNLERIALDSSTKAQKFLEESKVRAVCKVASSILFKHPNFKLILPFFYRSSIREASEDLNLVRWGLRQIHGDVSNEKRQRILEEFNSPSGEVRVLVAQISTIGVSLDLDDKSGNWPRVMICFPTFRFIDTVQLAHRIMRMGTKSKARVRFVFSMQYELEIKMIESFISKQRTMSSLKNKDHFKLPSKYMVLSPEEELWEES